MDVGEVYRVDASRRTTAANAYVGGLGKTKRVVLYDNLISGLPARPNALGRGARARPPKAQRPDPRPGLARARGARRDLPRPSARRALRAPRTTNKSRKPGPIVLPAIALSLAIVSFGARAPLPTCSRARSRPARTPSRCGLTDDPAAFVQLERRLALRNISDPDPPSVLHTALFGTHPTTAERIGIGEAFNLSQ